MNVSNEALRTRIRWLTALLMAGLVVSGATAIPLPAELGWLARAFDVDTEHLASGDQGVRGWIWQIWSDLKEVNAQYPFLAYGTDWLAFGHFVIAIAFIGAWRDPVRNIWLFDFGLIACALVVPYAMIFGAVRGIPWWWRLVDCSFGVMGAIPLWWCRKYARQLGAWPAPWT